MATKASMLLNPFQVRTWTRRPLYTPKAWDDSGPQVGLIDHLQIYNLDHLVSHVPLCNVVRDTYGADPTL